MAGDCGHLNWLGDNGLDQQGTTEIRLFLVDPDGLFGALLSITDTYQEFSLLYSTRFGHNTQLNLISSAALHGRIESNAYIAIGRMYMTNQYLFPTHVQGA